MTDQHYLIAALGACAAATLLSSVYFAVRPRPTRRTTWTSPVKWHLLQAGLAATGSIVSAACVLAVLQLAAV